MNRMAAPPPFPDAPPPPPPAPKRVRTALILAALFGPVGLFYASTLGGLLTLFLAVVVGLFTVGVGLPAVWLFCVLWAYVTVHDEPPAGDERPG